MKIIPVIDILNGVVVHAVKGKRNEYHPLKSCLGDSNEPIIVASKFKALGFDDLYIADLDAITGKGDNLGVIRAISKRCDTRIMVDAGTFEAKQARNLFHNGASKVIVGTETLPNLEAVKQLLKFFGDERITVSLDLKAGNVLSKSRSLHSMKAFEVACQLQNTGVEELIVLDLARVGSSEGPDFPLLQKLRASLELELIAGGGVRNSEDLITLKNIGVKGVLLATALHSGKIPLEMLSSEDFLGT